MIDIVPVRSPDKFRGLIGEWESFLAETGRDSVFFSPWWYLSWWEAFGENVSLEILCFRTNGRLIGIAPCCRRGKRLQFLASQEVTDYSDIVISGGREKEAISVFMDFVFDQGSFFRGMNLINIPYSSPLLRMIPELGRIRGLDVRIHPAEVTPILALPPSYEKFMSAVGRKNRHELRRKIRKIEALDSVSCDFVSNEEEIEREMGEFIALHRGSSEEKERFWNTPGMIPFFLKIALRLAERKNLEIISLRMRDELMSALILFRCGRVMMLYNIAVNRKFRHLSPGFFLFNEAIRRAIEGGMEEMDFLRGGERYKYFFGARDRKIFSVMVDKEVQPA